MGRTPMDASSFPLIFQRDAGAHIHLGILMPGFSAKEHVTMTLNATELELIGEISAIEAPFGQTLDSGSCVAGPFGPFQRKVTLGHPIDASTPVTAEMKNGIVEFR